VIENMGGARIDLDSAQTSLQLQNTGLPPILLSGISDQTVDTLGTTILVFRETIIAGIDSGDYAVSVNIRGSSNGAPFSRTISTGVVTIGGDIFFGPFSVSPNLVLQGQQNINVIMRIGNLGLPLPIDLIGTKITFRDSLGAELLVPTLTRTDTLTILQSIPDNELTFQFDIPADFPVGPISINGQISLDGGALIKTSPAALGTITVFSGVNLVYIATSLSDTSVVPNQAVEFTLALEDTGRVPNLPGI